MNYKQRFGSFYNSKEWKSLRNRKWADANGLCEECLKKGKVVQAKEIHHIIPIEKNWNKRLDYDNLIALCDECHRMKHNRSSPLQEFNKIWEEIEWQEEKQ